MTDLYLHEKELGALGYRHIAGIDEAGRGPLAGPVVAAAVILKPGAVFRYVDDSKKLSEIKRNLALEEIKKNALSIKIAFVSVDEIDRINIYRATKLAMKSAIEGLSVASDFLLIDAMPIEIDIPQRNIIRGDALSISIAAASIVAKTTRDAYMVEMDGLFPEYGFLDHKGYGTKKHIEAIRLHGITPIHRKTFRPVKDMIEKE